MRKILITLPIAALVLAIGVLIAGESIGGGSPVATSDPNPVSDSDLQGSEWLETTKGAPGSSRCTTPPGLSRR